MSNYYESDIEPAFGAEDFKPSKNDKPGIHFVKVDKTRRLGRVPICDCGYIGYNGELHCPQCQSFMWQKSKTRFIADGSIRL